MGKNCSQLTSRATHPSACDSYALRLRQEYMRVKDPD
jgi:hypothetical protein